MPTRLMSARCLSMAQARSSISASMDCSFSPPYDSPRRRCGWPVEFPGQIRERLQREAQPGQGQ